MINEIYRSIAMGLKRIKGCTVYMEDVPQNFTQPSFLIELYDQNPSKGINGCLNNTVRVDVHYFPEDKREKNEECWEMGQGLMRELRIDGFKIKSRNLKITDGVLHFMFDVCYRECLEDTAPAMQTMSQKTNIKEE